MKKKDLSHGFADKRVPVSGGKGGFAVGKDGEVLLFNLYAV